MAYQRIREPSLVKHFEEMAIQAAIRGDYGFEEKMKDLAYQAHKGFEVFDDETDPEDDYGND